MFLFSLAFRLVTGTVKVVTLVFLGLLCADYANQKIAEAQDSLSKMSWNEIEPQILKFGNSVYERAKVETKKLVASVGEKTGGLKKVSEQQGRAKQSLYRF